MVWLTHANNFTKKLQLNGRPVIVTNLARMFPREITDLNELPRFWVSYVHYLNSECDKAGVTDYTA